MANTTGASNYSSETALELIKRFLREVGQPIDQAALRNILLDEAQVRERHPHLAREPLRVVPDVRVIDTGRAGETAGGAAASVLGVRTRSDIEGGDGQEETGANIIMTRRRVDLPKESLDDSTQSVDGSNRNINNSSNTNSNTNNGGQPVSSFFE